MIRGVLFVTFFIVDTQTRRDKIGKKKIMKRKRKSEKQEEREERQTKGVKVCQLVGYTKKHFSNDKQQIYEVWTLYV